MIITLTKSEIKTLLAALLSARQNEISLIDAHRTEFTDDPLKPKKFPKSSLILVNETCRFIDQIDKLYQKVCERRKVSK